MNINQQSHNAALNSYESKSENNTKHSQNGFSDLGIAPSILKAINRLRFENPTPIQKESIPVAIQGDDLIALAQTGSGKTLAFGIPMLQRLAKSKRATGLVLVPTRELAIQVEESLQAISRPLGIRSAVLIGGASMIMQINILKKKARVIIATPGRLMDHLERGTVNLSNVEVFVLDEADRMLDMGFVPDIKKIIKSIPDGRQNMLFSATMPKQIESIARQLMDNPVRIEVAGTGIPPSEVSQEIYMIKNQDKGRLLAHHFKQCTGPVLVFTRTKRMAAKLKEKVNQMGFTSAEIHSDRSQGQRRNALEGFKRGRYQILIATDIAARGIDVKGIELVVNYDMAANSEDYVHRIGRTGRAGMTGHAITFATSAQKGAIRDLERFMKTKLTLSSLPSELPSERSVLKDAIENGVNIDYSDDRPSRRRNSRDGRPSERKFSRERSPKRKDYKKSDSNKYSSKQDDSKLSRIKDEFPMDAKRFSKKSPDKNNRTIDDFFKNDSKKFAAKKSDSRRFDSDSSRDSNSSNRNDFRKTDSQNASSRRFSSKDSGFKKDYSNNERPAKRNFSRDGKPSNRKYSSDRSSDRRDFKKSDSQKAFSKDSDSNERNFNRKSSGYLDSKPQKPRDAEFKKPDSDGDKKPFWSNFSKGGTKKKKSVGQGSGRKRRSKK